MSAIREDTGRATPEASLVGHHFDFKGTTVPVFLIGRRPTNARGVWISCSLCGCSVRFPIYNGHAEFRGPRVCPGSP